jgi:RNA polymerase sigma-70 factor (sigma-E family)
VIEPATLDPVTDVTAGSAADFREFYEAERERLGRALFLLTGSSHEAEDLAQEALVRVYERWGRVREMGSPVGYLYRTAMNLHRSRLRRVAVATRKLVFHATPSTTTESVEDRDEISRAIDGLPLGQRQALVLIDWLGMTAEETGRVLGLKPVSVRVRLSRAHAALREQLEANDE